MSMLYYDNRWWSLCQVIRELEFTFRVDICEVSYPHYIDRVYGTKAGPLVVIVMVCYMWL